MYKYTVLILNPREMSLLRWLIKDAPKHYPMTRAQREFVLPKLKAKAQK